MARRKGRDRGNVERITSAEDGLALISSPAVPMPRAQSRALANLMSSMPNVVEAHLPLCYLVGSPDPPAQILYVIHRPEMPSDETLKQITEGLSKLELAADRLDIFLRTPDDRWLESVRKSGTEIFPRYKRPPWWKFATWRAWWRRSFGVRNPFGGESHLISDGVRTEPPLPSFKAKFKRR